MRADQVALRARRLALQSGALRLLAGTQLERIIATLDSRSRASRFSTHPDLWSDTLQSATGAGRAGARMRAQLNARHAKRSGTALFLIGHVTKEGSHRRPRVLEHIVIPCSIFEATRIPRFAWCVR